MRGPFTLIALVALVALSTALSGCDTAAPPSEPLRAMTWSLDIGADRARLDDARGGSADARVAGFYIDVLNSGPLARAEAAATAISANAPDVVALQEVLTVRSQFPSDWSAGEAPDARVVRLDVLPRLLESLAALGTPYTVASEATVADWERPARFGTSVSDLRVTERVVILVREGTQTAQARAISLPPRRIPVAGAPIEIDAAAAYVIARGVSVATFRLDALDEAAAIKVSALASELPGSPLLLPVHVGASGAGSAGAALVSAGFRDAWAELVGDGGATCCRTSGAEPSDRRSDLIAARGDVLFLNVAPVNGRAAGATSGASASQFDAVVSDLLVRE